MRVHGAISIWDKDPKSIRLLRQIFLISKSKRCIPVSSPMNLKPGILSGHTKVARFLGKKVKRKYHRLQITLLTNKNNDSSAGIQNHNLADE